jgi:tetratricopeptide (TPR) repeat protein
MADLRSVVQQYPDSAYADDAALLLARAYYFYEEDADKAIEGLYEVARKYPKGAWIAEDPITREVIATAVLIYGPERGLRSRQKGSRSLMATQYMPYMGYAAQHPNLTADEAKYWIAQIILHAKLEARYAEAEKVLREVIESHRRDQRTLQDLQAAKRMDNELIAKRLLRPERLAHYLLIGTLKRRGDMEAAQREAQDFARLHAGHRDVEAVRSMGLLPQ